MPDYQRRAASQTEQRPWPVLAVYAWDVLLGILAIVGALAALGGQVAIGTHVVTLPLALQILEALSSAAFAAALIMVASLLTRPRIWVRRVQIATMSIAIALAVLYSVLAAITGGLSTVRLLVSLLLVLLDLLVIVIMTERRIVTWYVEQGKVPTFVSITVGFWAVTSAVLAIVEAVL